jgi:hypothetical protein
VTDLLLADVDRRPNIYDLERAPEAFVDPILRDLGNPRSSWTRWGRVASRRCLPDERTSV